MTTLPFALDRPLFRFKALAAQAGRASLGGDREVVLACFMVARLGGAMLPPVALGPSENGTRATAARNWLASLALPAPLRAAALAAIDSVAAGDRAAVARAMGALGEAAAGQLDAASTEELLDLADELRAVSRQQAAGSR
jgi:hypothetical protein